MKKFARLISALDSTTKTNAKLEALVNYLDEGSDRDKIWCVALLTGKRPKRPVKTALLRTWAAEEANLPLWLFEESYYIVGDLAETVALILPPSGQNDSKSLHERMMQLKSLHQKDEKEVRHEITRAWKEMSKVERFVFNKLITGGFRIGVSQKLMVRALSKHTGIEEAKLSHRLMGNWVPAETHFSELILESSSTENLSRPYPFYLAYPLESDPEELGSPEKWQIEFKWDGIRGQVIKRDGKVYIWSRGEELVTDRFPELVEMGQTLDRDAVLDGEIIAYKDGAPLTFNHLQTRIGRKRITKKILENSPVKLIAYDLLEYEGSDIRQEPMEKRRIFLEQLINSNPHDALILSECIKEKSWSGVAKIRGKSRSLMAEGLMLKRKSSEYKVGRKRGDWWKWKVDPMAIDAVLIYAMRGHGRRANLYSDYTFAVWDKGELIPFAKAYSGLTDKEIKEVDRFVKQNILEKFGPVRSVEPHLVFEIGFEGIAPSTRHKSGIALRFPRMLRWRKDKSPQEANTLEHLQSMLDVYQDGN
ncbi:MAG: ATP-dependent DNA ligase [Flavobacteriales bacterium]|nr:ATP-dependent DNA ligase [Flavobacteriales bacterium]